MTLDPYAPPKTESARDGAPAVGPGGELPRVWAEGPNLAVRLGAKIPAVCLKCGVTTSIVRRDHAFTWMPADKRRNALVVRLLFGALGGALMEASNAKHRRAAMLSLPLCEGCDQRWAQGKKLGLVAALLFLGAIVLVVVSQSEHLMSPIASLVLFFAAFAGIVAVSRFVIPPRYVHAERIGDTFIVLRGVAPAAVAEAVRMAGKKKQRKPQDALVDDAVM